MALPKSAEQSRPPDPWPLTPGPFPLAQLVRLPNVFTAFADILLGALATQALPARWLPAGLLMLASGSLYCGGMVWNDFFDLEQDRRERPFRPLPAGKISRRSAGLFGAALLAAGVGWAGLAAVAGGLGLAPVLIACLLVVSILLYDAWLKRTWAGPVGMGLCRFLNVLLGLSVAGRLPWSWGSYLAVVVGIYVAGVTWFARSEARTSSRAALAGAAGVMLAGLILALPLPVRLAEGASSPLFPYLLVGLGFVVGLPVCRALSWPSPPRVQKAVRRAVLGLVALDAVLASGLAGNIGLVILVLLVPALYLGRRLYST